MARNFALVLSAALLVACGGGQKQPETPEPETSFDEPQTEPEDVGEEPSEPASSGGPHSEFGDRPPPVPEAWEPVQADCDDLAKKYEQLLLIVEMDKLEKRKIQDKHRAAAEQNVRNTAKQGANNWLQACNEIVGTVQSKPRWDCAFKANTLERFNGCMDGKYDGDLEDK